MNVIILRGISGAGKSTWTKQNHPRAIVVSGDHFFTRTDGTYVYDANKIHDAHIACFKNYLAALERKDPEIVVDNTNILAWEISPYLLAAEVYGYNVQLLTLVCDPEVAAARKQLVPKEKVRALASLLDQESQRLPKSMKKIHRLIRTDNA